MEQIIVWNNYNGDISWFKNLESYQDFILSGKGHIHYKEEEEADEYTFSHWDNSVYLVEEGAPYLDSEKVDLEKWQRALPRGI